MRFIGKVAIISGGSCGIGRAIALALLAEGAQVAVTSLKCDADDARHVFSARGYAPMILTGDMREETFCERVMQQVMAEFGRVDHLVNNAFSFVAKSFDATREDWLQSLEVGPLAYAKMMALALDPMKCHAGSIVNVSSISASIAQPRRWTYNTSKGAVLQLTRCAAMDFAPYGIRVNSVSPGWTWTRENEKAAGSDRVKYDKLWGEFAMLRRMAQPAEIALPVLFLLSDEASFITGADLPVDGGYQSLGPEGLGQHTVVAGSR